MHGSRVSTAQSSSSSAFHIVTSEVVSIHGTKIESNV
jgi:hypothetical protein